MSNIAIILSASEYESIAELPACRKDGQLIFEILQRTGRYDDILHLESSRPAIDEKRDLISFVERHRDQQIDEVFFYFSGHGDFDGKDFYYLLADYEAEHLHQTSLENSELDNFLRSLKPRLTIKVVDACQSGVGYVKDKESLNDFIKGNLGQFESCYFMYSSLSDQRSYADDHMSDFTKSFVDSITKREGQEIRYKDISDYISDEFKDNMRQQPYFISQAKYTEIFAPAGISFAGILATEAVEATDGDEVEANQSPTQVSIREKVAAAAKDYRSKEEVFEFLTKFRDLLKDHLTGEPLRDFFELEWQEQSSTYSVVNDEEIGKWFMDRSHDFFARHTTKKIRPNEPPGDPITWTYYQRMQANYTETVVSGAYSTVNLPFEHLLVSAVPRFPNIDKTALSIVPFVSQTQMLLFYGLIYYRRTGWDQYSPTGPNWKTRTFTFDQSAQLDPFAFQLSERFVEFTMAPVVTAFK